MNKTPLYTTEGTTSAEINLPELFDTPVDEQLIHRYFVWARNQIRHTISHTKTRGEVRGGGKKPWKQKGTGRARAGSSRSPIWIGGGITFGPRSNRNWQTNMPRTERRKALFSALSAKAHNSSILVLDEWNLEQPKTALAASVFQKLPLSGSKTLIVQNNNPMLVRSVKNIKNINTCTIPELNIIDILHSSTIVFTKDSLDSLEKHFSTEL